MIHSLKQCNLGIKYFGANTDTQKLVYNENQIDLRMGGVAYLSLCVTHSVVQSFGLHSDICDISFELELNGNFYDFLLKMCFNVKYINIYLMNQT